MLRRELLTRSGLALAAGAMGSSAGLLDAAAQDNPLVGADGLDWPAVRAQFALRDEFIHMSAMLLSSHPKAVRRAIDEHRRGMDADPLTYVFENNRRLQEDARAAAGQYFGVDASDIALTDSTTMGVALVYNGLRLTEDQEILSTEQDYYVTHESIRLAGQRTGAKVRRISLYESIDGVGEEQIVDRVMQAITPSTRVLALTWVHSSTGLKLPLRAITQAVGELNAGRDENARVLVCVDGVHGFGIEDVVLADLGCEPQVALWAARDGHRGRYAAGVGVPPAHDPELHRQRQLASLVLRDRPGRSDDGEPDVSRRLQGLRAFVGLAEGLRIPSTDRQSTRGRADP
jgi:isopenicillin-N epimerase